MRSIIFGFVFLRATLSSPTAQNAPTRTIDAGVVVGTSTSTSSSPFRVDQFLGIPYAAPPVRFEPPQEPVRWSAPYNASSYKPACIQQFNYPLEQRTRIIEWLNTPGPPAGESEDCLNLNIYTPVSGENAKAVLFWIHGGVFSYGSGSLPLYDGTSFAANHDVVVVTINYRLNVFGFPGSSALPETTRNLALLDQRLALDWVQRNIAAFGGDPKRVTIFGESAGAGSVDALITSPPDPVPFHAAILQSGEKTLNPQSSESALSWAKIVNATNCPQEPTAALRCLRGKPASRLKEIIEREALPFDAILDDHTVSKTPRRARLDSISNPSLIARVPVMMGTNANEGSIYVIGQNDTETFLRMALQVLYPSGAPTDLVDKVLEAYPLGEPGLETEKDRIDRILTEVLAQCPIKVITEDSSGVNISTWRYYFDASFPNSELFPGSGAYHSAEIEMVFGTLDCRGATDAQREISKRMQKAWADFAKDPHNGPGWGMVPEVGVFGGGVSTGERNGGKAVFALATNDLDKRCQLWESLYRK